MIVRSLGQRFPDKKLKSIEQISLILGTVVSHPIVHKLIDNLVIRSKSVGVKCLTLVKTFVSSVMRMLWGRMEPLPSRAGVYLFFRPVCPQLGFRTINQVLNKFK